MKTCPLKNTKGARTTELTSSSHASAVLSVLHNHLCKMLIAAPPGIGFFAYVIAARSRYK